VKTALLRAVSHDLRTPLTGVRTAVGALRNPTLHLTDDDRAELLETIELDSDRLARLVGDLLDLSRLEAALLPRTRSCGRSTTSCARRVDSLGARARVDIVGEAPLVNVDAAQVQRVLANLIENALRYSPDEVACSCASRRRERRRSSAWSTRAPVWRRAIWSASSSRSTAMTGDPRSGAGLGLAIARGFRRGQRRSRVGESRPGQGATFALALRSSRHRRSCSRERSTRSGRRRRSRKSCARCARRCTEPATRSTWLRQLPRR